MFGVSLVAVVLAAGLTYVMIQAVNPVAMPPTVAADPAKIGPAATPADTDSKVATVPASSGDDNHTISRVIEPAGPGFDPRAKAGGAPAPTDHRATDAAAEATTAAKSRRRRPARLLRANHAGGEQESSLRPRCRQAASRCKPSHSALRHRRRRG